MLNAVLQECVPSTLNDKLNDQGRAIERNGVFFLQKMHRHHAQQMRFCEVVRQPKKVCFLTHLSARVVDSLFLSLVRRCSPHCAAKALNRVSFMTKKGRFEYQILFCPFLSFVHATRLPKIGLTSRDIADILSRIERKICAWQGKTTFALLQLTIEKARDCWR